MDKMTEANVQEKMLDTLTGLKQDVSHLKQDIHYIMEYLEDTRLTTEEKKLLDESIAKVKAGDESGFVDHKEAKKELGI